MTIDDALIETLLFGEEGVDLDFKRDQYNFLKATDNEKGEFLKDILAFANSWRRTDAYILIGIKEKKGGRAEVYGIDEKLDDAQIQQFVNSKTNVPITFSYQNIEFESKCVAVIHIPIQPRPIYLKKDYGKLKKEIVYIKRGSSTEIAKLEEIAKMGNSLYQIEQSHPILEVFFADIDKRVLLIDKHSFSSVVLNTLKNKDIPDYELPHQHQRNFYGLELERANNSYYRELAAFTKQNRLYSSINFAIKNTGSSVARDVRLDIKIQDPDNIIRVLDDGSILTKPKSSYSNIPQPFFTQMNNIKTTQYLNATRISDWWLIEAGVEKVQPKSITWLEKCLFLGVLKSVEFPIETNIYSDDLPEPSIKTLIVKGESEERAVNLEEIEELEMDRFRNSPEYEEILKWHSERSE